MTVRHQPFQTLQIAEAVLEIAPDGSSVLPLLRFPEGSMARFEFASGQVSHAVLHPGLDELWYVVDGSGEMWRRQETRSSIEPLMSGSCASIPRETAFQCRAGPAGLTVIAVTLPAWSGAADAIGATGPWVTNPD